MLGWVGVGCSGSGQCGPLARRRVVEEHRHGPPPSKEKERPVAKRRIIPRREWGAAPPTGSRIPQRPFEVVVHHTVYPTLRRTATKKQESARLRAIQRRHQARGWIDIGYHLIIFPSGRAYRGRPLKTVGAHVESHNTGRVGIAFDGNFQTSTPTRAAIDTLVWLVRRHRVLRGMRVVGHRDFGGTACPGDNLYPITKKL
jgi:N-acetylmuramoyl-L-alanine amidase